MNKLTPQTSAALSFHSQKGGRFFCLDPATRGAEREEAPGLGLRSLSIVRHFAGIGIGVTMPYSVQLIRPR